MGKRKAPRPPKPGYVYLMLGADGLYKIGVSRDPYRRLKQLSTGAAIPPRLIHVIETDDMYRLESLWHKAYKHLRYRAEWYNLTPAAVDDITSYGRVIYYGGNNGDTRLTIERLRRVTGASNRVSG
jgi:hypothetical protein